MQRPQVVERIRQILKETLPVLYGSEARGDAHSDSDIDLLILVNGSQLSVQEEECIRSPLYDLELESGVLINARVVLKKIWENRSFLTPFHMNVMKEGIIL